MEEKLEFGECYICLEDTPLLSQCFCVQRFLCENCMEKLRIYNYRECTVCHAKYPKTVSEERIDIQFDLEQEEQIENDKYACTPCCLRPKRHRHNPKYCALDTCVHIFCIYSFMLVSSCTVNFTNTCYGWSIMSYFFPSIIAYAIICTFLAVVRR